MVNQDTLSRLNPQTVEPAAAPMTEEEFDAKVAAIRAEVREIKADKAGLAAAIQRCEADIKAQEGGR